MVIVCLSPHHSPPFPSIYLFIYLYRYFQNGCSVVVLSCTYFRYCNCAVLVNQCVFRISPFGASGRLCLMIVTSSE